MRSGADLRGGSPLVSFDHVIDPHFVTFSSSLYTTISNPNPNANANPNTNPNSNHIPNPNPNPNPNRNPTVITDPQIGPIDPQIVTVRIRSAFCCPACDSCHALVLLDMHAHTLIDIITCFISILVPSFYSQTVLQNSVQFHPLNAGVVGLLTMANFDSISA